GLAGAGARRGSCGVGPAAAALAPAGDGEVPDPVHPLAGLRVLVVGAGSMSALAVATAHRLGAAGIVVTNRTPERAERLAASVSGAPAGFAELPAALGCADPVISCTGGAGLGLTADVARGALPLASRRARG